MILKQKACQKFAQIMKPKGKPRKKATSRFRTIITKTRCAWSGTVQRRYHSATVLSISVQSVITCTVQVNRWLRQNNDENCFVKLQKYAFLKQNNFMRIDKITISLFPFV